MAYTDRLALIKQVEQLRGGNVLLTYVTSTRQGLESMMTPDAISRTYQLLREIDAKKKDTKIDLFIHSNGGDGIVPWKLVTLIREFCGEFNVIVPNRAFSAATLTALGANNIFMHPMGMLGPTDPKVMNEFNPEDPKNPTQRFGINVEDVFSYIALVRDDVGITHEDELVKAWEYLAGPGRVHPLALGNVKRFYSQSRMMAKKLLSLHMDGTSEAHKVEEIADNLNSKLYFHGHPINRDEARELGLPVQNLSPKLEEAVWALYSSYEQEMKLEEPFRPDLALKSSGPYPLIGQPNQSPKTINIDDEVVTCIESAKKSYILKVGFTVEGYRFMSQNGIQEQTNLQQKSEKWHETKPESVPE